MKRLLLVTLMILLTMPHPLIAGLDAPRQVKKKTQDKVTFVPLAVYLDPAGQSLGAYQFELKVRQGRVKIVGVEGGGHPAFKSPPYYDPAALAGDRIIIAAFSTEDNLPRQRTRVATLHLQVVGDVKPVYELNIMATADASGNPIQITTSLDEGEQP